MKRGSCHSSVLLAALWALCVLGLLAMPACKAKPAASDPDNTEDLATPAATCEQMRCVDPDTICCNDEPCVDIKTNPQHCGACGKTCSNLEACSNGQCVCRGGGGSQTCGAGTACCPDRPAFVGGCKNLQTDTANCGSCGRACRASETCTAGSCQCGGGPGCSGAQTCCAMGCANTQEDPNNCGACGKKCAAGKACKGGVCEGECTGCAMGETCCDGKCANLLNDATNCGMCGKTCGKVLGIPLPCLFGICAFAGDGGPAPVDGFSSDM